LERAPSPSGPWTPIATQTAPASGLIEFLDANAPSGQAFYRAAILPPAINLCLDFNDAQVPPGSQAFGMAYVGTDGIVHLTDPTNDVFGAFVVTLPAPQFFQSFHASWRSLIGAGEFGGADGYSFNVADDLPNPPSYGNPGEEGAGSGLTVTVDTWENGNGDAPGLEIKWRGQRVGFTAVNKEFLRQDRFVDAELRVSPSGLATFTYDGVAVSAQLPDYTHLTATQCMFGSRTGGANDRHWIDDLCIR
jgi:hypothetical protein